MATTIDDHADRIVRRPLVQRPTRFTFDTMPSKSTVQKAKRDLREGKSPSTAAGEFVHEEMDHIREHKHGARSPRQAIAIGLSKARRAGVPLKPPRRGHTSARTRKSAERDKATGQGRRKPRASSARRRKATPERCAGKGPQRPARARCPAKVATPLSAAATPIARAPPRRAPPPRARAAARRRPSAAPSRAGAAAADQPPPSASSAPSSSPRAWASPRWVATSMPRAYTARAAARSPSARWVLPACR